ncbi:MAG: hypothetical protein XD76_0590 [candidate division TA06 bacterium 32_111]|uniref:Uncharacterized protein n=2 Tax=Bacteria candidate phyla TaxID=1783234 RepID=A0A117M6Y5_UNCT6|nr:MAG: hypothetical protein XD76_0590 [candidate division TA06 bacterium 32_111]KUK87776.1 MAG: hypothetical protein XE03_0295 [candidate division TA06 bacterium 34_109]HAF07932.1 hypothetical protein [candidate division WOR-3 bacterium]HCP16366.1 hypothetical protein [candidate division WOR-3 bacterium]
MNILFDIFKIKKYKQDIENLKKDKENFIKLLKGDINSFYNLDNKSLKKIIESEVGIKFNQLKDLEEKYLENHKRNEDLKEYIEENNNRLNKLKNEIEEKEILFEKIKKLEEDEVSYEEKRKQLEEKKEKLYYDNLKYKEEKTKLKEKKKILEREKEKFNKDSDLLNKSREKLINENKDLIDKKEKLEKSIENLKKENEIKLLQIQEIDRNLERKKQEIEEFNIKIKELTDNKNSLEKQNKRFKELSKDNLILVLMEIDVANGFAYEFAPQIFKRLYKIDKERSIKWITEVLARDKNEQIKITEEICALINEGLTSIDQKSNKVEELFAKKIAFKFNKNYEELLGDYIKAWENYINEQ